MPHFLLNDCEIDLDVAPDAVILDVLRLRLGLTGTKEGCREGDCGACAVLVGEPQGDFVLYRPVCACLLPAGDVDGRHLVTIEGLRVEGLSPVQRALVDGGGIQCGFCTPGVVVALTGHLLSAPVVTDGGALAGLAGNVCRCTGYAGIRRAVGLLTARLPELGPPGKERIERLIALGVLPGSFATAAARLSTTAPGLSASAPGTALRLDHRLVIGGGTDLLVASVEKLRGKPLRFAGREERLRGIARDGDAVAVGAAVTAAQLQESPEVAACFPALRDALALFASPLIRNRATVAGNLVNASPIGDLAIALLALGARIVLEKDDESRTIALEDLYLGYKKLSLREGELVTRIDIPIPVPGARFHFEKVSRRRLLDIASVNSALAVVEERGVVTWARLSAGGVAPVPLLLRDTSRALAGRPPTEETVREVAKLAVAEVAPITDVRGSTSYKSLLLERLVWAHFAALFPDRIGPMSEVAP